MHRGRRPGDAQDALSDQPWNRTPSFALDGDLIAGYFVRVQIITAADAAPLRAVLAMADRQQAAGTEVFGRNLVHVQDLAAAHAPLR